jgi:hypothetical protein
MKGLLQGLGGQLCLTAVTLQALPHFEAVALSGFGLLCDVSLSRRHSIAPSSCEGPLRLPSTQTHAPHAPRVCESEVLSASRASRTSCFLLSNICGINTPERLFNFPHRLLHASSA